MPLEITTREVEGILVCTFTGSITAGDRSAAVRRLVKELSESGKIRAVINLKTVDFIDSSGLGALILAHSTMKAAGGALKLAHLSNRQIQLLVITRLTTVFELFDDEADAVNSFFPNRQVKAFDLLKFLKKK